MNDWLQIAIGALIVGLVLWVALSHGRANPTGTGKLSRQINKLFAELRRIEAKVDQAVTSAEFEEIHGELRRVEAGAAGKDLVVALEGKLNRMEERLKGHADTTQARIEAVHDLTDRTAEGVKRIEAILMKGALDR
jgi:hypothetical protein